MSRTNDNGMINTCNEIEESFFKNLAQKPPKNIIVPEKDRDRKDIVSVAQDYSTEEVLTELYETRDSLVDMVKQESDFSSPLVDNINKIGNCIKKLGGAVEDFDPFLHVTGLQIPNMVKNAHRVIENTKESYTLGRIGESKVNDDGKIITIVFSGIKNNIAYKATGTVVAPKIWVGNEAIEYIYSQGSGKLSVKSLNEDGKWIDKSGNYNISWELSEGQMNTAEKTTEKAIEKNAENKEENKEEIKVDAKNNIPKDDMGDNINDDFVIEEKK